jgi:transposase InsO family protein
LLNDRVIPFFDEQGLRSDRVLTDRGTEYCGAHDRHEYELYLAVEDIDHTRTRMKSPQTNGICERFHKTLLDEFYRVAFRKKVYRSIEELQADLDEWMRHYNEARTRGAGDRLVRGGAPLHRHCPGHARRAGRRGRMEHPGTHGADARRLYRHPRGHGARRR